MAYRNSNKDEETLDKRFSPYKGNMSESEFWEFDREMEGFKNIKGMYDETAFLKSKGALNANGDVVISGFQEIPVPAAHRKGETMPDCYPIKYEEYSRKIEQWKSWRKSKKLDKININEYSITL